MSPNLTTTDFTSETHRAAMESLNDWRGGTLGNAFTWEDVENLEAKYPNLGFGGFNRNTSGFLSEYKSENGPVGINRAADFLRTMTQIPASNDDATHSYGLKHDVERLLGGTRYISNGELIAAALLVGVDVGTYDDGDPNASIGVPNGEVQFFANRQVGGGSGTVTESKPPRWNEFNTFLESVGFPDLTDYLDAMAYQVKVTGRCQDIYLRVPYDHGAEAGEPLHDIFKAAENHNCGSKCDARDDTLNTVMFQSPRSWRFVYDNWNGTLIWDHLEHLGLDVPAQDELDRLYDPYWVDPDPEDDE